MAEELFRYVDDCPGYLVTNYGRVFSRWRRGKKGLHAPKELKRVIHRGRYKTTLTTAEGKHCKFLVADLVLRAFYPEGWDENSRFQRAGHVDGDMLNDHIENLYYTDRDEYRTPPGRKPNEESNSVRKIQSKTKGEGGEL